MEAQGQVNYSFSFLIPKKIFSAEILFKFLVIKALDPDGVRIKIGIQPKMPDPDEMNADPQPYLILKSKVTRQNSNILTKMDTLSPTTSTSL